jgi:hypothetical protein
LHRLAWRLSSKSEIYVSESSFMFMTGFIIGELEVESAASPRLIAYGWSISSFSSWICLKYWSLNVLSAVGGGGQKSSLLRQGRFRILHAIWASEGTLEMSMFAPFTYRLLTITMDLSLIQDHPCSDSFIRILTFFWWQESQERDIFAWAIFHLLPAEDMSPRFAIRILWGEQNSLQYQRSWLQGLMVSSRWFRNTSRRESLQRRFKKESVNVGDERPRTLFDFPLYCHVWGFLPPRKVTVLVGVETARAVLVDRNSLYRKLGANSD